MKTIVSSPTVESLIEHCVSTLSLKMQRERGKEERSFHVVCVVKSFVAGDTYCGGYILREESEDVLQEFVTVLL